MAITQNTYTGNGSTTNYSFTFEYLQQSDVKVTLDEVETTAYTLANATTVAFTTAPANGVAIRIFRETATTLGTTFFPGSAIKAEDLNDNFTQNLYVTQESDTEASLAKTTAATAKTTADGAVTTANAASTAASGAATDAAAAVSTANAASSTASTAASDATTAVNTANTANTNATTALNNSREDDGSGGFTSAISKANTAITTANTANTNATDALNNSRENDGSGGFTSAISKANSAVSTANTANTNATDALNNSREDDGSGNFTSAISKANTALSTANAATQAVADAQVYTPIANLAALPGSPSNEDRVEIINSTGAESSSAITGLPSGFTGSSDLTLRVQYSSSSSKWEFKQYFAVDPEARYYPKASGESNATAISGKMNTSGGTFSGDVSFDGEIIAKGDSTNAGKITLNCEDNDHAVKIKGPPHSAAATYTLTLPNGTGSSGQVLKTDGSGNLDWVNLTSGFNSFNVSDGTNSETVTNGQSIEFTGSNGISAAVSSPDTVTITGTNASTSAKGVASFNSADFGVTSGDVTLADTVVKTVTTDSGALTPSSHGFSILGGEGINVTHTGTNVSVAGEDASTSNKGVASFNSTDFTVNTGAVTVNTDRIKDIAGAMFTGNTETGITVTYQAADNTVDFVVDSQTDNNFTTALKNKLDAIEANADVTDATNVEAAGAVMETNATTANMSFVVDEDTMVSNSATKLPTQQSVKAYVDNEITNLDLEISTAGDTGNGAVNTSQSLTISGTANEITTTASGQVITIALPDDVTIGNALTVTNGVTVDGSYKQAAEAVSALNIDLSTGNYFTKTINANSTFTFSNPPSSGTVGSFTLELTHTSGTVTWPSSVKFNSDTAPTLTTGKTHLFFFVTDDGGTRYRGAALVDYVN